MDNKCDQLVMHKVQAWIGFTTVSYKVDRETGVISSFSYSELSG